MGFAMLLHARAYQAVIDHDLKPSVWRMRKGHGKHRTTVKYILGLSTVFVLTMQLRHV
jgi:hypothetical protein